MRVPFTKMQGLGNDFVVLDDLRPRSRGPLPLDARAARILCDRRHGVGADQVLWLLPPGEPGTDARLRIFNPDGSEAEMCGNGVRAVALYLRERGPAPGMGRYVVATAGGTKVLEIRDDGQVSVDMGPPRLGQGFGSGNPGHPLRAAGRDLEVFEVSMGNPHAVVFLGGSPKGHPCEAEGPAIETHPDFPQRTNVEFVQVESPSRLLVRVWERGTGLTLACGTGACASAVAAISTGKARSPVTVALPGGELTIRWEGGNSPVWMTGPAARVFDGEIDWASLSDPLS